MKKLLFIIGCIFVCLLQAPDLQAQVNTSIFSRFSWITTSNLVQQDRCTNEKIAVYRTGIYEYLLITDANGTEKLYNQDGLFYCQNASNYDCIAAYNLGVPVDNWTCNSASISDTDDMEQSKEDSYWTALPTHFERYHLIYSICKGDTFSIKQSLTRSYLCSGPAGPVGIPTPIDLVGQYRQLNIAASPKGEHATVTDKGTIFHPTKTTAFSVFYQALTCAPKEIGGGPLYNGFHVLVIVDEEADCQASEQVTFLIEACIGEEVTIPTPNLPYSGGSSKCRFDGTYQLSGEEVAIFSEPTRLSNQNKVLIKGEGTFQIDALKGKDACFNNHSYRYQVRLKPDCTTSASDNAIFNAYPWLMDFINPTNCGSAKVEVYEGGGATYLLVTDDKRVAKLYNERGQFYCQNGPGYDCVALYNLDGPHGNWTCPAAATDCETETIINRLKESEEPSSCYEVTRINQVDYNGTSYFRTHVGRTIASFLQNEPCEAQENFGATYDCEGRKICDFTAPVPPPDYDPVVCEALTDQPDRIIWQDEENTCNIGNPLTLAFIEELIQTPNEFACTQVKEIIQIVYQGFTFFRINYEFIINSTVACPAVASPTDVFLDCKGNFVTAVTGTCSPGSLCADLDALSGSTIWLRERNITTTIPPDFQQYDLIFTICKGDTLFMPSPLIDAHTCIGPAGPTTPNPPNPGQRPITCFSPITWETSAPRSFAEQDKKLRFYPTQTTAYTGRVAASNNRDTSFTFLVVVEESASCGIARSVSAEEAAPTFKIEVCKGDIIHLPGPNVSDVNEARVCSQILTYPEGQIEELSRNCNDYEIQVNEAGFLRSNGPHPAFQPFPPFEAVWPYITYEYDIQFKSDCGGNNPAIFNDYSWLSDLVNINNCSTEKVAVYQQGIYNYLLVTDASGDSKLYNQDGQFYCQNSSNYDCVAAYNLGAPIATWACESSGDCGCPRVIDPVCGSDLNIYNNACEATCAGVEVIGDGANCGLDEPCKITITNNQCRRIGVYDENDKLLTLLQSGPHPLGQSTEPSVWEDAIPLQFNETRTYIFKENDLVLGRQTVCCEQPQVRVVSNQNSACTDVLQAVEINNTGCRNIEVHNTSGEIIQMISPEEPIVLDFGFVIYIFKAGNDTLQVLSEISFDTRSLDLDSGGCETNNPNCNNYTGTIFFRTCDNGQQFYLIETEDGRIFDPYFSSDILYDPLEGQKVNFDFTEANFASPCSLAEKAINITCIEAADNPSNNGDCTKNQGTIFFDNCDDGTEFFFIRTAIGKVLDVYFADGISFVKYPNQKVNFDYVAADFDSPCSIADQAVIVTCIEEDTDETTPITCNYLSTIRFDPCDPNIKEIAVYEYRGKQYVVTEPATTTEVQDLEITALDCETGELFCAEGELLASNLDLLLCGLFLAEATKVQVVVNRERDCPDTCPLEDCDLTRLPSDFVNYNIIYAICEGDTLTIPDRLRILQCPTGAQGPAGNMPPPLDIVGAPPIFQRPAWASNTGDNYRANASVDPTKATISFYPTQTTVYSGIFPVASCESGPAGNSFTYLIIVKKGENCQTTTEPTFLVEGCIGEEVIIPSPLLPAYNTADACAESRVFTGGGVVETAEPIFPFNREIKVRILQEGVFQVETSGGRGDYNAPINAEFDQVDCADLTYRFQVRLKPDCSIENNSGNTIFDKFDWLRTLVNPDNCNGERITAYPSGVHQFVYVDTPSGRKLYFQDGTFYCEDSPGYDCRSAYNLTMITDSWTCSNFQESSNDERARADTEQLDLSLFPNPTTGRFTIQVLPNLKQEQQLRVVDLFGRVLVQEVIQPGVSQLSVDLSDYQNGVYHLELRAKGKRLIKRVIKDDLD